MEILGLEEIPVINQNRQYWFIRTMKGKLYDEFFNNGYVAIAYNSINFDDLYKLSEYELRDKVSQLLSSKQVSTVDEELIDEGNENGNSNLDRKISSTINKLRTFVGMKADDIVIIPKYQSTEFAFGRVVSDQPYSDSENIEVCNFYKRKKINWIEKKTRFELDPIFNTLRINQHGISNVDLKLAPYIDRVMQPIYIKDDILTVVFNITDQNDISLVTFNSFINEFIELCNKNGNVDDISIKLRLNSPGQVSFSQSFRNNTSSLAIAAMTLALSSCNNNVNEKRISNSNLNLTEHQNVRDSLILDEQSLSFYSNVR